MSGVAITGLQWGDEGKGKIIDCLALEADIVCRYQGGQNAGHTIWVGDEKTVLHIVPSGVLYPGKVCVIGNGTVIDLEGLSAELQGLEGRGVDTSEVYVSERAHIVFPFHKRLDGARERARAGGKIGTTKRGIGPCYADKASRRGLRVVELYHERTFRERLEFLIKEKNAILEGVYGEEGFSFDEIYARFRELAEELRPRIRDTGRLLQDAMRQDQRILFEGAQGVMLDVDHGTYPFVTSSNASVCGIPSGAGVPPSVVTSSIGVVKAYTTRVGEGPFPTELDGERGEALRSAGKEFGATTGRPRRCGWLDLLQVRYSVNLCGVKGLAMTKLDVLSGLDKLKVAIAYERGGEILTDFPASLEVLAESKPLYRELPGFSCDFDAVEALEDLPREARDYIGFVEAHTGVPVVMVSTGPQRAQMFRRGHAEDLWSISV